MKCCTGLSRSDRDRCFVQVLCSFRLGDVSAGQSLRLCFEPAAYEVQLTPVMGSRSRFDAQVHPRAYTARIGVFAQRYLVHNSSTVLFPGSISRHLGGFGCWKKQCPRALDEIFPIVSSLAGFGTFPSRCRATILARKKNRMYRCTKTPNPTVYACSSLLRAAPVLIICASRTFRYLRCSALCVCVRVCACVCARARATVGVSVCGVFLRSKSVKSTLLSAECCAKPVSVGSEFVQCVSLYLYCIYVVLRRLSMALS